MSEGKEIRFQLTKGELKEYGRKLFYVSCLRQKESLTAYLCLAVLTVILPFFVSLWFFYVKGIGAVCWPPLLVAAVLGSYVWVQYPRAICQSLVKAGFLKERAYRLEKGLLYYEEDNSITPCRLYTYASRTKRLILIGMELGSGRISMLPFPKRCFEGEGDFLGFLDYFTHPMEARVEEHPGGGTFNYYYKLDSDGFAHIYAQMLELNRAMYASGRRTSLILMTVIGAGGLCLSLYYMAVYHDYSLVFTLGFPLGVLGISLYQSGRVKREEDCRELLKRGRLFEDGTGAWELAFMEDKIRVRRRDMVFDCKWQDYSRLFRTRDTLLFFSVRPGFKTSFLPLPEWVFKDHGEEERLVAFCRRQGVRLEQAGTLKKVRPEAARREKEAAKQQGEGGKRWLAFGGFFSMLFFAVLAAVFVFALRFKAENSRYGGAPYEIFSAYDEEQEETEFNPGDYPDYVPLDIQVETLRSLGIDGLETELVEEQRRWMEEYETARIYTEGYPYYSLLTSVGAGGFDQESGEFIHLSKTVYWFDFESWDISQDYLNILMGIQDLSGGEFELSGLYEDTQKVDWENGSGTIEVKFAVNGRPYSFQAKVEYDWLDSDIIPYFNRALKENGIEKRVYCAGDNGQGAILFYNTAKWAGEFETKTGIKLEAPI